MSGTVTALEAKHATDLGARDLTLADLVKSHAESLKVMETKQMEVVSTMEVEHATNLGKSFTLIHNRIYYQLCMVQAIEIY